MIDARLQPTWDGWRDAARPLLAARVPADRIRWVIAGDPQAALFGSAPIVAPGEPPRLPRAFYDLARYAVCADENERFALPYRVALRLADDRTLLDDFGDADVRELRRRAKAVRHEIHQMHAFVRFRPAGDGWIAFHRPEHFVVMEACTHFVARFGEAAFAVLTPRGSAVYAPGHALREAPPVERDPGDGDAEFRALWQTYYASIYNPARPALATFEGKLPKRHWDTLPEVAVLPQLLRETPARLRAHAEASAGNVAQLLPASGADLPRALAGCAACPLHLGTTGAVPGEGPRTARWMLVGEQPGDAEDLAGRPFVGPAGRVLDRALADAGLDRGTAFVTNAVKHFHHKKDERGRRLHQNPERGHVEVCKPWLAFELADVRPDVVVALGGTAALALLGRVVAVGRMRGQRLPGPDGAVVLVAPHPSAVLRAGDGGDAVYAHLVETLRDVAAILQG